MRGFVAGSLVLIVLYVALQPGTADKAEQGGNVLVGMLRRALSPEVAGVPDKASTTALIKKKSQPRGGGGGGAKVL